MSMLVTKENKIMTGISYIQNQNKSSSNSVGSGAVCGIIGMSAYHLPVTKDRFVRSAYNIVKEQTEETLEQMNEAAVSAQKGRLSNEQKVFLAQNGVGETVAEINNKIADLKKNILDSDVVKNIKTSFANNFENYKKSEALMDSVASKAFKNIKWRNFTWGAGIGFVLGAVLGSGQKNNAPSRPSV